MRPTAAWIALAATFAACAPVAAAEQAPAPAAPTRPVTITVPLLDGELYLGDVTATVGAGTNDIDVPAARILTLLEPVLQPATFTLLRNQIGRRDRLRPADAGTLAVPLRYAADKVALVAQIAPGLRAVQSLPVGTASTLPAGDFATAAHFSAVLNARGALHHTQGLGTRGLVFLDGGLRIGRLVLEADGAWHAGGGGGFERRATRLVVDFPEQALRLSAGDINPSARGFQSAPAMAGLSLVRSYGALQPYRSSRPSGRRSFTLDSRSVVEVFVNDRMERRLDLAPGTYDLRDFPFAQGANSIVVAIRDGSGRTEDLRFDTFLDQSQLATGLDEFGLFFGVLAPPGPTGPQYGDRPAATAFYRRGISDALTVGGNLQADSEGQMTGLQAVLTGSLGTWRADAALSRDRQLGTGAAAALIFTRTFGAAQGAARVLNLSAEAATRGFQPIGPGVQPRSYAWQFDAQYVHGFTSALSGAASVRVGKSWQSSNRVQSYRANLDWLATARLRLTIEARHDRPGFSQSRESALRATLRVRMGRASSLSLDYDSRLPAARLGFTHAAGQGVGALSIDAEAERTPDGAGLNADVNFTANRAELGFSRFTNLDGPAASVTTLRLSTALAFADGAFAVGPPVRDSFAIVTRHRSLAGSDIRVDPGPTSHAASTGALGTALRGDLGSYLERTISVDSPDAPITANLGSGAFRVMPPYRSGYRLQVGSNYSLSAVGQLLDPLGRPLSLLGGIARELRANGATIEIFTNREGRFGATGLRAGPWLLEFGGDAPISYAVTIPDKTDGIVSLGTLAPRGDAP